MREQAFVGTVNTMTFARRAGHWDEWLARTPAQSVTMRDGQLTLWLPAPSLLVTRVDGGLSEVGAEAIVLGMVRVLSADRSLLMLHDWESMLDYAPSVGSRVVDAASRAGDGLEGAHFLLPTRPNVLGTLGAIALLRRVTIHPTHGGFERVMADEMLRRRERHVSGVRTVLIPPR